MSGCPDWLTDLPFTDPQSCRTFTPAPLAQEWRSNIVGAGAGNDLSSAFLAGPFFHFQSRSCRFSTCSTLIEFGFAIAELTKNVPESLSFGFFVVRKCEVLHRPFAASAPPEFMPCRRNGQRPGMGIGTQLAFRPVVFPRVADRPGRKIVRRISYVIVTWKSFASWRSVALRGGQSRSERMMAFVAESCVTFFFSPLKRSCPGMGRRW